MSQKQRVQATATYVHDLLCYNSIGNHKRKVHHQTCTPGVAACPAVCPPAESSNRQIAWP